MKSMEWCQAAANQLCWRHIEIINRSALKTVEAWVQHKTDFLRRELGPDIIFCLNSRIQKVVWELSLSSECNCAVQFCLWCQRNLSRALWEIPLCLRVLQGKPLFVVSLVFNTSLLFLQEPAGAPTGSSCDFLPAWRTKWKAKCTRSDFGEEKTGG